MVQRTLTNAVAVGFGLVMAFVFLRKGQILGGCSILGMMMVFVALAFSRDNSDRFLVLSIAAVAGSVAFAYFAVVSEITGVATCYKTSYNLRFVGELVTRQDFPAKFREANNYKWGLSVICAGIGAASYGFRRRLKQPDI